MLPEFPFVYEMLAGQTYSVALAKRFEAALGLKERQTRSLAKNLDSLSEEQKSAVADYTMSHLSELNPDGASNILPELKSVEGAFSEGYWWKWKGELVTAKALTLPCFGQSFGEYTEQVILKFLGIAEGIRGTVPPDPGNIWSFCKKHEFLSRFAHAPETFNESPRNLAVLLLFRELLYVFAAFEAELHLSRLPPDSQHSRIAKYVIPEVEKGRSPQSGWLNMVFSASDIGGIRHASRSVPLVSYGKIINDWYEPLRMSIHKWRRGHNKNTKGKNVAALMSWEYCQQFVGIFETKLKAVLPQEYPDIDEQEMADHILDCTNVLRSYFAIARAMTVVYAALKIELGLSQEEIAAYFKTYCDWYVEHMAAQKDAAGA